MPKVGERGSVPEPVERWLPVPEWPDYEVSTFGRVRSLPRLRDAGRAGRRLTKIKYPALVLRNYIVSVKLSRGENTAIERRTFGVANLVLRTFVRPPLDGEVARHYYDPNPANCHLYNLRWGTHKENTADETRHYGKHHSKGVPCSEERKAKISSSNMGKTYSEEVIDNMTAGQRKRRQTSVVSEETKAKQAAAQKARWAKVPEAERSANTEKAVAEAARLKRLRR